MIIQNYHSQADKDFDDILSNKNTWPISTLYLCIWFALAGCPQCDRCVVRGACPHTPLAGPSTPPSCAWTVPATGTPGDAPGPPSQTDRCPSSRAAGDNRTQVIHGQSKLVCVCVCVCACMCVCVCACVRVCVCVHCQVTCKCRLQRSHKELLLFSTSSDTLYQS